MDELMVVGAIFALLVIGGALMGWLSMLRVRELEQRLRKVEAELSSDRSRSESHVMHNTSARQGVDKSDPDANTPALGTITVETRPASREEARDERMASPTLFKQLMTRVLHGITGKAAAGRGAHEVGRDSAKHDAPAMARLFTLIREHWMILVGALSLVMAGVLLVGYSLEQGLLGPGLRMALGLGFGVGLIVLAEWLRLRTNQSPSLTGAVSGAGSLVAAASLLAGYYLLSLTSLSVTFVLLALLSLWTLERARHHGPWLAALGMLGGYALPLALPIQSQLGGDSSLMLLGHLGVIALACRLLHRQIAASWLYWGGLWGALLWWLVLLPQGLTEGASDSIHAMGMLERTLAGVWLCLLAVAYLFPWRDETDSVQEVASGAVQGMEVEERESSSSWLPWRAASSIRRHWLAAGVLGVINALSLLLLSTAGLTSPSDNPTGLVQPGVWLPGVMLVWVIGWTSRGSAASWSAACIAVAAWLLAWGLSVPAGNGAWEVLVPLILSGGLMVLASRTSCSARMSCEEACLLSACWWALATLTPLLAWGVGVWLAIIPVEMGAGGSVGWLNAALPPLVWGILCWLGANRFNAREGIKLAAGLWLPAQFGIALALVIALEGPSLTLALALQLLGLTACEWRWWRHQANEPDVGRSLFAELARLLAWGLILRLMYEVATDGYVGIAHWPLQIILPVLLCVGLASYGMRHRPDTQRWLEGGVVQLAIATAVLEIRYLLTGGEPFSGVLSLPELALQALALTGVAASYAWRARGAGKSARLYRVLAQGVGGLALLVWLAGVVIAFNPLWHAGGVGKWPLLNWLLPAYGLPVIGAVLVWRMSGDNAHRRHICEGLGLMAAGLWIGLSLRHVWHGEMLEMWRGVEQAELYAYSAALLIMAAGLVVGGSRLSLMHWQRVGQGLLVVTVVKVGVWDTATLEGLWRVASWLGLGTVLMLLSALFKRLAGAGARPEAAE